jgi:hypothetical protein
LACGEELSYQDLGVHNNSAPLGGTLETAEIEDEEELLESSTLPLHVIRWILVGQRKEDKAKDGWLCTDIFHTRVEHQGKALNVIIDNGSGMNVASQKIVHKLKLPIEKHPQPYKLSWFDDTSIPVKNRCLISFHWQKIIRMPSSPT